jgi:spore coat protein U-like protein
MKRLHRVLAATALLLAQPWLANMAPAATTCSASATDLAFGAVTGASDVDSTASVTVDCTTGALSSLSSGTARVRMCLSIGDGVNGDGQTDPRQMKNGDGDLLQFQIYSNAGRTDIWGSSTNPNTPNTVNLDLEYSVLALLGGSGSVSATMYGRVFAQGGLARGSYTNPFTGSHTRVDYRYAEQLLGTPPYPTSCTSGGDGGGSITFPFTASASVADNCTIGITTDLAFGHVPSQISADQDQTSSISFTCTGRTPWQVGLNGGLHASGNTRRMRLGATDSYVSYELYRDPSRTLRWGDTLDTDTVSGTGTGSEQGLTVYGRVPASQSVPHGDYSDTVTVTVTY